MPTATKLVAAIVLAATGWFCAELIKPMMEEGRDLSRFSPICVAVGVLVGWRYLGRRIDKQLGSFGANALTTAFVFLGVALFIFSFSEMIKQSMRRNYDGPVEAVMDLFIIGWDYVLKYFNAEVVAVALLGCFIASWLASRAARVWG